MMTLDFVLDNKHGSEKDHKGHENTKVQTSIQDFYLIHFSIKPYTPTSYLRNVWKILLGKHGVFCKTFNNIYSYI